MASTIRDLLMAKGQEDVVAKFDGEIKRDRQARRREYERQQHKTQPARQPTPTQHVAKQAPKAAPTKKAGPQPQAKPSRKPKTAAQPKQSAEVAAASNRTAGGHAKPPRLKQAQPKAPVQKRPQQPAPAKQPAPTKPIPTVDSLKSESAHSKYQAVFQVFEVSTYVRFLGEMDMESLESLARKEGRSLHFRLWQKQSVAILGAPGGPAQKSKQAAAKAPAAQNRPVDTSAHEPAAVERSASDKPETKKERSARERRVRIVNRKGEVIDHLPKAEINAKYEGYIKQDEWNTFLATREKKARPNTGTTGGAGHPSHST